MFSHAGRANSAPSNPTSRWGTSQGWEGKGRCSARIHHWNKFQPLTDNSCVCSQDKRTRCKNASNIASWHAAHHATIQTYTVTDFLSTDTNKALRPLEIHFALQAGVNYRWVGWRCAGWQLVPVGVEYKSRTATTMSTVRPQLAVTH